MSNLTKEDYINLLQGHSVGSHFSCQYFTVKRAEKKKPSQQQILTDSAVGLPATLNEEYSEPPNLKKAKKRKLNNQVDPTLMRMLR